MPSRCWERPPNPSNTTHCNNVDLIFNQHCFNVSCFLESPVLIESHKRNRTSDVNNYMYVAFAVGEPAPTTSKLNSSTEWQQGLAAFLARPADVDQHWATYIRTRCRITMPFIRAHYQCNVDKITYLQKINYFMRQR